MRSHHALIGVTAFALSLAPAPGEPADACPGSPFVNLIRPRAIEESSGAIVGPQFFDAATHPRGFVLFANNNGLITYDGAGYRLMPVGRANAALSVATSPDGRIFVGGSRTFGEVVQERDGTVIYQPFEAELSGDDKRFSDVWQVLVSPAGRVFFRSPERIFILQGGEIRVVAPATRFTAAALAGETLYVFDEGAGVVAINAAGTRPVIIARAPNGQRVTAMTAESENDLLLGTQDHRVLRMALATGETRPFGAAVSQIETSEILSLRVLSNGSIAVGTLRNGLVILDKNGRTELAMDRDTGLPDNAVLSLTATAGTLWAGTSGGIAQMQAPGPLQTFGPREGVAGIVEAMTEHDGTVYAATSQGVYRLACGARAFDGVPGLHEQSFALLSARSLLAATASGVYELQRGAVRLIHPGLTRGLTRARNGDVIWAATATGVIALGNNEGGWFESATLTLGAGADVKDLEGIEATSVGENADGRLWIAFAGGTVVSGKPHLSSQGAELEDVKVFGEKSGITGGFVQVLSLKDGVRIGTSSTVLKAEGAGLAADPAFTSALGTGNGAFRIRDSAQGGYWAASAKRPVRLSKGPSGLEIRSTSLMRAPAGSRILDFLESSTGEVWIGTDDGAIRYDPRLDNVANSPIAALVRRVESKGVELFRGGVDEALATPLHHLVSLRFEVASTSLDDPSRSRFRFRLDGQDADWGPWTSEPRKDYTNLGPGAFKFRVETRDVYGRVGKEAALSFVVNTPWYRKPLALVLGLLAIGMIFLVVLRARTRTLERRQHELEQIVDQKTAELRDASFTDPLTGLRNRRYFAEIIEAEASLACRPGSPALHLFLVDLDHFKQVNDTHGHSAGDEVLRQTSARLKTAMRTSDLIFRWGGEEFLIVARGAADLPRNEIANRIVRMIGNESFDITGGIRLARTCSVGFATFPFYTTDPNAVPLDAVMELADLSLYRAKHTGRNRAVGVSPQAGAHVSSDTWKDKVLENLEKVAVSVEVLEGPPPHDD